MLTPDPSPRVQAMTTQASSPANDERVLLFRRWLQLPTVESSTSPRSPRATGSKCGSHPNTAQTSCHYKEGGAEEIGTQMEQELAEPRSCAKMDRTGE